MLQPMRQTPDKPAFAPLVCPIKTHRLIEDIILLDPIKTIKILNYKHSDLM